MWPRLVVFSAIVSVVIDAGSVGMCRTECIERNVLKIVRVHLKDQLVMAGLCSNKTTSSGSIVTPYVCHRNVGLWTFDELDEEGIVPFEKECPTPEQYPSELRATCPQISENQDQSPQRVNEENDEYPSSGEAPVPL